MFWKNPRFQIDWPTDAGAAYEAVLRLSPVDHYVEKQGRSTGRYEMRGPHGRESFYLKKYLRLPWWLRWLSPLGAFPGPRELENLRLAERLGVPVPEVLAAGAERGNRCQSFLAVRELAGFAPLHEYIPQRLAAQRGGGASHRRALARRLAEIARRLHGAQLYHRDFYLCHIFIRPDRDAADGFELAMIDFLRLKHSRRSRWRIKDLAQFLFSADLPAVTRTDQLRFFKAYIGRKRLTAADRALLIQVQRKADRYRRHNSKMTNV